MLKNQFDYPADCKAYLCGNSLGLMPSKLKVEIDKVLDIWSMEAVQGHFKHGNAELATSRKLMPLIGAKYDHEVACMSELSVNLHLLLSCFYDSKKLQSSSSSSSGSGKKKIKILMETHSFPSDLLVVQSFLRNRGIIEMDAAGAEGILFFPMTDPNSMYSDPKEVFKFIREHGDEIALMLLGAVNYYTGQLFPLESLCKLCHELDIVVGLDLAHAIGNVPLYLHDWKVDFATWCSYKYLNSGPGSISGIFVHDQSKYFNRNLILKGWWGINDQVKLKFNVDPNKDGMVDMAPGAKALQISNPSTLLLRCVQVAASMFPPMEQVRDYSFQLTTLCRTLLKEKIQIKYPSDVQVRIITPPSKDESGAQLSFYISPPEKAKSVFDSLTQRKIIGDYRPPNVIRITFCALYNDEQDVKLFCNQFEEILHEHIYDVPID